MHRNFLLSYYYYNSMKECNACRTQKPYSEFNYRNKAKQWYQSVCRECQKVRDKLSYARPERKLAIHISNTRRELEIKDWIWNILINTSCKDCGYNNPLALQFDHIITGKRFNFADAARLGQSDEKLQAELNKCEIVCANCHSIRTASRARNWKYIRLYS